MKSVAFIIPGRIHTPDMLEYEKVAVMFKKKNINPIPVEVNWKRTTISQNLEQFLEEYKKIQAGKKYVLGFSFGAIIALIASTKVNFDTIILCSLSPYFAEDIPNIPNWWIKSIGKKRKNDFESLRNKEIAKNVHAKTILLYGTLEGSEVEKRVNQTFSNLKSVKELIVLDGVKHNLADKRYLSAVEKVINTL